MAVSSNLKFILDFVPQLADDKVAAIIIRLVNAFQQAGGNLELIDFDALQRDVDELQQHLDEIDLDEVEKAVTGLETKFKNIDLSEIEQAIASLGKDLDLDEFEKQLEQIGDADLDDLAKKMQDAVENFDADKLSKELNVAADEYDKHVRKVTEEYERQRKVVAALKLEGKDRTEEGKKQVQILKQMESEYEKIKDIEGSLGKSGGLDFDRFFKMDQTVQSLSNTLSNLSKPFAELDTQVKNIGTLGVENFEEFGSMALDLSKRIPDSAATIAAGAYNAISAGITGTNQEIIDFVEVAGKVAVAGVSDTNSAVNGLTSVLNAYKLNAADAGEVSNIFFAGIKLGKVSFEEFNASLANMVPAASSAGVQFSELSAFIAQMTALGVPASQASTQIRAAIIELQKPGSDLAGVMSKVSVTVDGVTQSLNESNIGKVLKEQGLAATLQQIEGAAAGMGKSMTQVFSSSEAASAALLVTGENAEKMNATLKQIGNEVAGGAAFTAYEVAATGIEARTKLLVNTVTAAFSNIFQSFGSGVNVIIGATAQIAPMVSSIAGAAQLFEGPLGKVTEKMSGMMGEIGKLTGLESKIGPIVKNIGSKLGSLGPALANPWVAGTAVAIGALALFFTQTERGQKIFADLKEKAVAVWEFFKPLVESSVEVLGSFLGIVGEIGSLLIEVLLTPIEIFFSNIGAGIDLFLSLFGVVSDGTDGVDQLADILSLVADFLDKIADGIATFRDGFSYAKQVYMEFITQAESITTAFAEFATTALNPVHWIDGDLSAAKEKLSAALFNTVGEAVKKANEKISAAKLGENLTAAIALQGDIDKNKTLEKLVADFQSAKTDIERASIAEAIQKQVPGAVKATGRVIDEQGKLIIQYDVAADKVAKYAAAQDKALSSQLSGKQKDIVAGIEAQSSAYTRAQQQQQLLADQIVKSAAQGKDVSALKEKYDKVTETVKEQSEKIKENIGKAIDLKVDLSGAKVTPEFQQEFQVELKKIEVAAREAKIGESVTKAVSIQGSLDQQGQLEQLVAKLKTAKDEAEKNNIAEQIRRQMPEAVTETLKGVDANGQLIKTLEVSTEKVEENVRANRSRFSSDLLQQQASYRDELLVEGQTYQQNLDKARALTEEIQQKRELKIDTTVLEKSLSDTQKVVVSSREKVLSMGKEYEKLGLNSADAIDDISKALRTSDQEARDLVETQKKYSEEANRSKANVDALAEAFNKAKSAASSATSKGIAALSELTVELQQAKKDGDKARIAELQRQIDEEVATTRAQVRTKKELARVEENISVLVGETVRQGRSAYDIAKEKYAQQQKEIANSETLTQIAYDRLLIEEDRDKTSRDDLVQSNLKLDNIRKQKEEYLKTMSAFVQVNKETGAIELKTKKKEYREEITSTLDQFNRDLQSQENSIDSLELKVSVDTKAFEDTKEQVEREQLNVEIELGLKTKSDLLDIVKADAEKVEKELAGSSATLLKFDEQYAEERTRIQTELQVSEQQAEEILLASRQALVLKNLELQKQEVESRKSVQQLTDEIYREELSDLQARNDQTLSEMESRQQAELTLIERFTALQDAVLNRRNDDNLSSQTSGIDAEADKQISALQDLKDRELLTEETFEKRKAALEEEFRKRREEAEKEHARQQLLIQEALRGQQLAVQIEQDKERLSQIESAKRKELEIAEKLAAGKADDSEEARAAKRVAQELSDIQTELQEKGDLLVVLSGELQGTVTETLSNLYAGNDEEAKEPFRKLLATLAGVLEKTASGVVTKIVLDALALTPGGLLALLAVPLIQTTVNAGVSKLIRPVLSSLTSFASGGRVDEPTFAVVGDAARLGNDNTEWILRDEHISFIVKETSRQMSVPVVAELRNVRQAIENLNGRFYVLERDIYNANSRVQNEIERRGR